MISSDKMPFGYVLPFIELQEKIPSLANFKVLFERFEGMRQSTAFAERFRKLFRMLFKTLETFRDMLLTYR